MKNHSPAFQFYPADYLADAKVQAMSIEGEGCYIRLMSYCWREGFIPGDRVAISRLCKGYDGPGIDEALSCFIFNKKKNIFVHKRLESEKIKQEMFHKSQQEAGLRGAEKRWGRYRQPITTPMAKNSSSIFSLQSSDIKKDKSLSRQPIIEMWNEFSVKHNLPKIGDIKSGSKRDRHLKARMKENGFDFTVLLRHVGESAFLTGKKTDFRATFDWIIAPSNYTKIMEGNYKGGTGGTYNAEAQVGRTPQRAKSAEETAALEAARKREKAKVDLRRKLYDENKTAIEAAQAKGDGGAVERIMENIERRVEGGA